MFPAITTSTCRRRHPSPRRPTRYQRSIIIKKQPSEWPKMRVSSPLSVTDKASSITVYFPTELGDQSTISAVLYANQNHPELKIDHPQWSDRYKQIMKKWRALSADKKAPYLQRARDNRSAQQAQLRTKKAQQVSLVVRLVIETTHTRNEKRSRREVFSGRICAQNFFCWFSFCLIVLRVFIHRPPTHGREFHCIVKYCMLHPHSYPF